MAAAALLGRAVRNENHQPFLRTTLHNRVRTCATESLGGTVGAFSDSPGSRMSILATMMEDGLDEDCGGNTGTLGRYRGVVRKAHHPHRLIYLWAAECLRVYSLIDCACRATIVVSTRVSNPLIARHCRELTHSRADRHKRPLYCLFSPIRHLQQHTRSARLGLLVWYVPVW